jgi:hypothetical protein
MAPDPTSDTVYIQRSVQILSDVNDALGNMNTINHHSVNLHLFGLYIENEIQLMHLLCYTSMYAAMQSLSYEKVNYHMI